MFVLCMVVSASAGSTLRHNLKDLKIIINKASPNRIEHDVLAYEGRHYTWAKFARTIRLLE